MNITLMMESWNITYWFFMSPARELNRQNTEQKIAWNERLKLSPSTCFSQTFSFGLEHFERIIKSPRCLEAYWRFGFGYTKLPKFYNKSRMQDSHHQGDDFSNPGPLSSPEYPYDQRPRPQQKKTREESFRKFLWR